MIRLRLLSRPDCGLCDEMRARIDELLEDRPHEWEIVDIDAEPDLARRFSDVIPILYVNDRVFAKTRLPPIATRLRLLRAASLG